MKNANEVRCADCGGHVKSEEVLKAKEQLETLRVSLEIEEIKQRIEEMKLGRCVNNAKRAEKMDEVMSQFALETLPELKVVIQALALVLTAHIKDMAPAAKPAAKPVSK